MSADRERGSLPAQNPGALPTAPAAAAELRGGDSERDRREAARDRRDIRALLLRNVWAQGLSLARQFVILPLISPAELGIFKYITTLTGYSRMAGLGGTSALQVRYPEAEGAGDQDQCDQLQAAAWWQTVLGSLLFPLIFLAAAWHFELSGFALIALAILGVTPLLSDYVTASFNVRGQFSTLARMDLWVITLGFIAVVAGTYFYGLEGLLLTSFMTMLGRCLFGRRYFRPPDRRLKLGEWKKQFFFGLRVWVGSATSTFANTGDMIVLGYLIAKNAPGLGHYALGITVAQILSQNVRALTIVQQRAIQVEIGRQGSFSAPPVYKRFVDSLALDGLVASLVAALTLTMAAIALPLVFPAYGPAVAPLGPILASVVVLKLGRYPSSLLYQGDRIAELALSSALQILAMIGLFALVATRGGSVHEYALARLAAMSLGFAVQLYFALALMSKKGQVAALGLRTAFALAPVLALTSLGILWFDGVFAQLLLGALLVAATLGGFALGFPGVGRRALDLLFGSLRQRLRRLRRRP